MPHKSATSHNVIVTIDPRIELMSIIQLLADYFLLSPYQTDYRRMAQAHFGGFVDHECVEHYARLSQQSFNGDAVPSAFLVLSDPPVLHQRMPFPGNTLERAGGAATLDSWFAELRDFAKQSRFMEFFQRQQPVFNNIIAKTQQAAQQAIIPLRSYLGVPLDNCHLILGMLLHHGGFGPAISPSDGPEEYYALIGPIGSKKNLPNFGSAKDIAIITWHEWSHSVINPLADAHSTLIASSEQLYQPIAKHMAFHGYDSWHITAIEHIINAITTRLIAQVFGEQASAVALDELLQDDYCYLPPLLERLMEYEVQRERYPTLSSFFPYLLDAFPHDR